VGRGVGASVREVLDLVIEVTGIDMAPEVRDRRVGDPAKVVADAGLIAARLGWHASLNLREMIESAWQGWTSYRETKRSQAADLI
jgi:UDP-glucose 4-epimerase